MLASLVAAGDQLGGDDPSAWKADAEAERIRFLPGAALSMHWVNRPTTQQIAMFGRRAGAPRLKLRISRCGRRATLAGRDVRRVDSAVFRVDRRRASTDRRAPFTRPLRRLSPGRHVLRVSVRARGARGRVTLRRAFRVCR